VGGAVFQRLLRHGDPAEQRVFEQHLQELGEFDFRVHSEEFD